MKKIFFSLCLVFICSIVFAANPPEIVLKSFNAKFPSASKISWGKEGKTEWEAEFTLKGKKTSANFSNEGIWLETEGSINLSELPASITKTILEKYKGWNIEEAFKIESSKKETTFEVEIKNGSKKKEVILKENGEVIK